MLWRQCKNFSVIEILGSSSGSATGMAVGIASRVIEAGAYITQIRSKTDWITKISNC